MKYYDVLAAAWQQHPAIAATTSCNALPTNISSNTVINDEDGSGAEDDLVIYECNVNDNFLGVFGIPLVAGRTFSKDIKTDAEQAVLLNETAAKALGWSAQEAIGKQFIHNGPKTVVGVVKDFHMHSLHLTIQPLLLRFDPTWSNYIAVKIQPGKSAEVIGLLESTLTKYSPYPFDYRFLDDHFNKLYSTERKLGEMFGFFTIVSILIASLGVFGLAAFSTTQRTKEIGIRKAHGATASDIVILFAKGFVYLIIIAFFLSAPLGWYLMETWLENFAYRVDISWWMFACAALLALTVAGLTIAYQSFKASLTDAATTLRN
ncbi:ABC transporter permease [Fulvivirgaceae bacterium PWU4]|uniref:ABC transporter permease n=1 Tax=Chryseosolibacter histidini TaxID=2782349 RepID=A0AAP2DJX8_9BACT|nr:FtsX-like permease family protein [Chryseosolibacter histidini]MBT1696733.1 ABC transporter permease [Chryseosolibacter histidini]